MKSRVCLQNFCDSDMLHFFFLRGVLGDARLFGGEGFLQRKKRKKKREKDIIYTRLCAHNHYDYSVKNKGNTNKALRIAIKEIKKLNIIC